ncbi:MAG TPA: polysaccharide deacetylase family protein [Candidatus Dormibacteraeota bacterium]|nr:polysaccharide deacetylase family protein [Candidatus Dormibacteraeota bacterium]
MCRRSHSGAVGALLLLAAALLASCGAPALPGAKGTPSAGVSAQPSPAPSLVADATSLAARFGHQLASGHYVAQWSELAPYARSLWPSVSARTAMLTAKFSGAARPISVVTARAHAAGRWTSPEDPAFSVAHTYVATITTEFASPTAMQPTGVAALFRSLQVVMEVQLPLTPHLRPQLASAPVLVLGEGPASLDAPVITPPSPPHLSARVPILMYHDVAPFPIRSQWSTQYAYDLEYGLTVTPAQFIQQMAFLSAAGANAISLPRLADFLLYDLPLPTNAVVITFDDGREGPAVYAVPVLQQYGFTATFFVPTGLVGTKVVNAAGMNPQSYLSWSQVDQLAAGGFWVEDHTLLDNHQLWGLPLAEVQQLAQSTALTLSQHTDLPVQFIAYTGLWPYSSGQQIGPSEVRVSGELEQMGYVEGLTDARTNSEAQSTQLIWELARIRMNPNQPASSLAAWLS